ncbi:GIY-YIG nuclease family protein [Lutispora saccharofermentans]|uniref:GIY-YIG nuclease family protein n=1 Tax=Lutispora saccharofermentans TaxID=3024236 RepID=A0ABT1NGQ0_9FIRM|nr:GIY-YIG nuclease family protein [Lutispora saccharofermentans]
MNLKEKVKNLTSAPGVYLMKDSLGSIIYVGKAKNLKKRVQSYFQESRPHSSKVEKLIKNLKDFEYIVTDTEFDALMLECKLIREIKPRYNRKMKSPLSYAYIIVRTGLEYPDIETAYARIKDDGNLYFGPYSSKNTVDSALDGIKEFYKILCSHPLKKNTPCLSYSLGLCTGVCLGGSAAEQYHDIIARIIAMLNGTDLSILEEMKGKMIYASEELDFEAAAKYRNYIDAVNYLINKEKVIEFAEENKNIAIIEDLSPNSVKLFLIKGAKVLFSEKYIRESSDIENLSAVIKANILTYFHDEISAASTKVAKDEIDEAQIIYGYLKSSACKHIIIPQEWLEHGGSTNIDEALNKLLQR